MCQPKPGLRCAGAVGKSRAANRAAEVRVYTDIAVLEAERPVDSQGEPVPDAGFERELGRLHRERFAIASKEARLADEWAKTPTGRAEQVLRRTPGTVEHAEALAERLHAGQVDKIGVSYIHHVRAVAAGVRETGGDDEEVIAGLLHDSVEDVDGVDAEFLRAQGVPEESIRLVEAVTHPKDEDYGDSIARVIRAGAKARRLKRADLGHNTLADRNAPLVRVKVALGRRRALAAGRDPDLAEQDVLRGTDRHAQKYADAKRALDRVDALQLA